MGNSATGSMATGDKAKDHTDRGHSSGEHGKGGRGKSGSVGFGGSGSMFDFASMFDYAAVPVAGFPAATCSSREFGHGYSGVGAWLLLWFDLSTEI